MADEDRPDPEKKHADNRRTTTHPKRRHDEYRRPANEDDDGYDPYSDRPAYEPRYEEDPWK